ncbi:MAG: hypothetical protein GY749_49920 [Desulfobacteraceae bacterium]|nr:hypothetical protein [Desulfobacteraceae bacterium]
MSEKDIRLSAEQNFENLIQNLEDEYLFPYNCDRSSEKQQLNLNESRLYEKQTGSNSNFNFSLKFNYHQYMVNNFFANIFKNEK